MLYRQIDKRIALMTVWMLSAVMVACTEDRSADAPRLDTDYSRLAVANPTDAPLTAASEATLLTLLKNGLRIQSNGTLPVATTAPTVMTTAPSGFSQTTVQTPGVDEADVVKYDGRHLFLLSNLATPIVSAGGPTIAPSIMPFVPLGFEAKLKILRTDSANATTVSVAETKLSGRQSFAPAMYRVSGAQDATDYVAVVSQVHRDPQPSSVRAPGWLGQQTAIELIDVRVPTAPVSAWRMEMDGWLRSSRQIGDTLYVVTEYRPWLGDLVLGATSDADLQANERRIRAASATDLLPKYVVDGIARPLATPTDCFVPSVTAPEHAYESLVFVIALDLRVRHISDVACLNTRSNGVYVSRESLYVGGVTGSVAIVGDLETAIHKFSLQNGQLHYRGVGAVVGTVGWNNSSYYLDEYQGDLRVMTTRNRFAADMSHHLTILRDGGNGRLTTIATLPNTTRPAPLGKPREHIQAVRFFGPRAYLVTFRMIDPLYVLDLSVPADPRIAGELQIPGFATYLQPLGEGPMERDYLWSVGRDANTNGTLGGIKIELFDVRDIAQPRSAGVQVVGNSGSFSDALADPHAITFLTLPGASQRYRMTVPIHVVDNAQSPSVNYLALYLFQVTGIENGNPQLRMQGAIRANSGRAVERSVMHDDAVFYAHGDEVIGRLWSTVTSN